MIDRTGPTPTGLLRRYLDLHWAAAGGGAGMARRLVHFDSDTPWGGRLVELLREVEQDERALEEIRAELDTTGGGARRAMAIAGERIGRLVPNGSVRGRSPLGRVLDLELMMSGVLAKRAMWSCLRSSGLDLRSADLAVLEQRADDQVALLRSVHAEASRDAFAPDASGSTADAP